MKRIGKIFLGILFLLVGIFVLCMNEQKNIKDYKKLKEVSQKVTVVNPDAIYESNNDKFVKLAGPLELSNPITDSFSNIKVQAVKLYRKVEVYQWNEKIKNGNATYEKVWDEALVSSSSFLESEGHENPTEVSYYSELQYPDLVKIGNYILTSDLLNSLDYNAEILEYPDAIQLPEGFSLDGKYITNSVDKENPQIGDVRISYSYYYGTSLSILGKQINNGYLTKYEEKDQDLTKVVPGIQNVEVLLDETILANKDWNFIFRILGLISLCLSIAFLSDFLATVKGFRRVFRKFLKQYHILISFSFGILLSMFCISLSWIFYLFAFGLTLLLLSIGFLILLLYFIKVKL